MATEEEFDIVVIGGGPGGYATALYGAAAGLSVANWAEDVFISVELAAMLLIGLPDSLWGYLHHVAGGRPDDILPEAS